MNSSRKRNVEKEMEDGMTKNRAERTRKVWGGRKEALRDRNWANGEKRERERRENSATSDSAALLGQCSILPQ